MTEISELVLDGLLQYAHSSVVNVELSHRAGGMLNDLADELGHGFNGNFSVAMKRPRKIDLDEPHRYRIDAIVQKEQIPPADATPLEQVFWRIAKKPPARYLQDSYSCRFRRAIFLVRTKDDCNQDQYLEGNKKTLDQNWGDQNADAFNQHGSRRSSGSVV